MHSLFAPVDTLDTSTYLHSVVSPNNSFALQWLTPVTGLQDNGQPITPPGLEKNYGLYLTVDASGILGQTTPTPVAAQFTSIDVTLWADPKNDAGTASSTVENGASFSGPTSNDIVLATGTMVSGMMSVDPTTGVRTATDVETLTSTVAGTILLDGSIKPGQQITENFTTQSGEFQALPQPEGTSIDLVNGGAATVTFSQPDGSPATISIPTDSLLQPALKFSITQADRIGMRRHPIYRGEKGKPRVRKLDGLERWRWSGTGSNASIAAPAPPADANAA